MKQQLIGLLLLVLTACSAKTPLVKDELSMIQIIDRSGRSETINQKEKLAAFQSIDFLTPQPYQKVTRILSRDKAQQTKSILTTYHTNGSIYEYLEAKASRANGIYEEWYPSGAKKISAHVIEGLAELNEHSKLSFVFDGSSEVFYETGKVKAQIPYEKGKIEGAVLYYYQNGNLEKSIAYHADLLHGKSLSYNEEGMLIGFTQYEKGERHGHTLYYGDGKSPPFEEWYEAGKLNKGIYYDLNQNTISRVSNGYGKQVIHEKGVIVKEIEYKNGFPEGTVRTYFFNGRLKEIYCIVDGKRHGEEWIYYDEAKERPKLWINWYQDEVHGVVKTWYPDGSLESQKEMIHNQKQGSSTAWYRTGGVMLMEEYNHDKLVNGIYYSKATQEKVSEVSQGTGVATLFDSEGYFLQKVKYEKGAIVHEN